MKKINAYIISAAMAVLVAGCSKGIENACDDTSNDVFTASFERSYAKSVFLPGYGASSVEWEAGDRINLSTDDYDYVYQTTASGSPTYFSAVGLSVPSAPMYYALYPYDAEAEFSNGTVTAEVPSVQETIHNSLSVHLAVASSSSTVLRFRNVCGLFRVRISDTGINRIVFEGNNNEYVAGSIRVTLDENPTWTAVSGVSHVELNAAAGNTFAEGDYYMAILPQTFSKGVKVTAYKTDGSSVVKTYSKPLTLDRGAIAGGEFTGGVWEVSTVNLLTSIASAQDLVLSPEGGFYMTIRDGGDLSKHGIYKVSSDCLTVTKLVAGAECAALTDSYPWGGDFDSYGLFYFTTKNAQKVMTCTSNGVVSEYPVNGVTLPHAMKVIIDADDNLYVLSRGEGAGNGKVYKVKGNEVLQTWNLTGALYETMCFNADKTAIFVFSNQSFDIQMIDLSDNSIRRIAGNAAGHSNSRTYRDGVPGFPLTATIGSVADAICTSDGTIYFNDTFSKTLRKFVPGPDSDYSKGLIRTIAGKSWPIEAAGNPATDLVKDAAGTDAVFIYPEGMALSPDGNTIYMVDGTDVNCRIRKITYTQN